MLMYCTYIIHKLIFLCSLHFGYICNSIFLIDLFSKESTTIKGKTFTLVKYVSCFFQGSWQQHPQMVSRGNTWYENKGEKQLPLTCLQKQKGKQQVFE